MKLIIGLGNPGPQYAGTRHNAGFDVVDLLASRWRINVAAERFHGWFGVGQVFGSPVGLLKPTTFMNRSGRAVAAAVRGNTLDLPDLLVISDDVALPLGRLRMRAGGSSGGHNGLQDIIDRLGDDRWTRLRIGIGPSVGIPTDFVLSHFSANEAELMGRARNRAADAVTCWVQSGVDLAMTRFNGDPPPVSG